MNSYRTMLRVAIGTLAFGQIEVAALAATGPAVPSAIESTGHWPAAERSAVERSPESVPAREARPQDRRPSGNPLWAIPLRSLTATRERPIFSPSRRPPSPPVVAAAYVPPAKAPVARPAEPDKPQLALVGTIAGENDGIGIFLDQATNAVIRLKTGQDHAGWVLRSVKGREAKFDRGRQTATLALPPPGSGPPPASPVGQATPGAPPGNTWMDGDGQLIAPPQRAATQPVAVKLPGAKTSVDSN